MRDNTALTNPIQWRDDVLLLLDQRCLPHAIRHVECRTVTAVEAAIRDMVVRGAPAIGIAAAYGIALGARQRFAADREHWRESLEDDFSTLRAARPTAVNLMWALDQMRTAVPAGDVDPFPALSARAVALHAEDRAANRALGEFGADLIAPGAGVLTHCNAGALATAGYGTALGVIRAGWRRGLINEVYATETRPWLQGARLTAWELIADGIDVTLIADSAAAYLMQTGRVHWVVTGADRIAANGDTANKIGTYALATLARAHGIRFMIAAPCSTIDPATASGADIPIEHREAAELTHFAGQPIAAPGVRALNPVFDVTPAALIDALVTEKGVVEHPHRDAIARLLQG
jgi:methylthioribose-1-phosphate isomerase